MMELARLVAAFARAVTELAVGVMEIPLRATELDCAVPQRAGAAAGRRRAGYRFLFPDPGGSTRGLKRTGRIPALETPFNELQSLNDPHPIPSPGRA
jgi:hypothetical protein